MNTPLFHLAQVLSKNQPLTFEFSQGVRAELSSEFFFQFLLLEEEDFKNHLPILPNGLRFVLNRDHLKKIIYHYSPKDFDAIEQRCQQLGGKLGFDPAFHFKDYTEWINLFSETKNKPAHRESWLSYLNEKKLKPPIFPNNTGHQTIFQEALTRESETDVFAFFIGETKKWNMGFHFTHLIRSVFKHERFDVLELLFENQDIRYAFTQTNGPQRKYPSPGDDLFYQKFQTLLDNSLELNKGSLDKAAQIYVKYLFKPSRAEYFQMFSDISKKESPHRGNNLSERCIQSILPCMESVLLRHQTQRNLEETIPVKKRSTL